jgi:translation initiation factor 3 subunit E
MSSTPSTSNNNNSSTNNNPTTTTTIPPSSLRKPPAPPTPKYDLLPKIAPYLDLHLVLVLIAFAEDLNIYVKEDLKQAKLDLLEGTNLVDWAIAIYGPNPPQEMIARRQVVIDTLNTLKSSAAPLLKLIEGPPEQYKGKNINTLEQEFGITKEILDSFFTFGKFQFECGNYDEATKLLTIYREIDLNGDHSFDALWGKLVSQILTSAISNSAPGIQACVQDIVEIQRQLDLRDSDPLRQPKHLEQLQLRAWLLHWALFVVFKTQDRNMVVDMYLNNKQNRNVVETLCPWLVRYVAVASITNKNRNRHVFKNLVSVIALEKYEYSDPITQFMEILISDFDFEKALELLTVCESVLAADYFLSGSIKNEFLESAKAMVFEAHCRTNLRIDLNMLCNKLDMAPEEAERWIVDLIRNARLDAKIDLESNCVIMGQSHQAVWQTIIDRTKDLGTRTFALGSGISQMMSEGLL